MSDWRPPARDGAAPSRVRTGERHANVLAFLERRFPAVADWPERLARGDVLGADGRALASADACPAGATIWYWRAPPPEPRVADALDVLHRDEQLVVVDKPHFLPVTPGGRHLHETALVRLQQALGLDTLAPIHRLDRETAGVLAFSVRPSERAAYHALLRERRAHKVYEAIVPWRDDLALPAIWRDRLAVQDGPAFMQTRVVDGEPNAELRVELIARVPGATLAHVRLTPSTGRKHQLRVQLAARGLPIVGDRIYPDLLPDLAPGAEEQVDVPLQLLARELAFTDPVTGAPRRFTSRRTLRLAPTTSTTPTTP